MASSELSRECRNSRHMSPRKHSPPPKLWELKYIHQFIPTKSRRPKKFPLRRDNRLLAATWLLACDAVNTTRLAMNGGLQVLVVRIYESSQLRSSAVPLVA